MNAIRVRLVLLALASSGIAGGCQWARNVTWDLSARENEPRESVPVPDEQDASYRKSVAEQRAQNEATFRAGNPGARR